MEIRLGALIWPRVSKRTGANRDVPLAARLNPSDFMENDCTVDFVLARFIRGVGDPTAVREKRAWRSLIFRNQVRERFPAGLEREQPNVRLGFRVHRCKQQETPIANPTRRILVFVGFDENPFILRAVRPFLIEVVRAVAVGTKNDVAPIR